MVFRCYDKIPEKFNLQGGQIYSFVYCLGYFRPVSWLNSLNGAKSTLWWEIYHGCKAYSQNERVERRQDQGPTVPSEDISMVISHPSIRTYLLRCWLPQWRPDLQNRAWGTSMMQRALGRLRCRHHIQMLAYFGLLLTWLLDLGFIEDLRIILK